MIRIVELPVGAMFVYQDQQFTVCEAIVDAPGRQACQGCYFLEHHGTCARLPHCSEPARIFLLTADAVALKLTGKLPDENC